jgi:hypothetical protein
VKPIDGSVNIVTDTAQRPYRVVQWTTGKVARQAVKAVLDDPDLELVGVFAHSEDKAGVDVGDLVDLGHTVGVSATNDVAALIALKPDCILYMPLHPNVDHLVKLLGAGINVLSTASFVTGRAYGEAARERLEQAARDGGASLFGGGVNPGYADYLASVASGVCRNVEHVRILESFNIGLWAGDANQDELGWGRPAGDPGHAEDIVRATAPFADAVEAMAELFKVNLDNIRCEVDFAHTLSAVDGIPGRTIKAGTVGGIDARWIGSVQGTDVIEANVRWTIAADVTPAWDIAMAYQIEVRGYPQVNIRAEVLPADMENMSLDDMMAIGSVITAMPIVNAIPAVVAARPGIVTYADLPPQSARIIPKMMNRSAD